MFFSFLTVYKEKQHGQLESKAVIERLTSREEAAFTEYIDRYEVFYEVSPASLSELCLGPSVMHIGCLNLSTCRTRPGSCAIGSSGIKLLLREDWANLTHLMLCKARFIKINAGSATKAWYTW